jgi:hypothetical protein
VKQRSASLSAGVDQAKSWLRNSTVGQVLGATRDFMRNYNEMVDANTIGADKFYHCKANCEATQRGAAGEGTAEVISDGREAFDRRVKGDPDSASQADQTANRAGRTGARASPGTSCDQICQPFTP